MGKAGGGRQEEDVGAKEFTIRFNLDAIINIHNNASNRTVCPTDSCSSSQESRDEPQPPAHRSIDRWTDKPLAKRKT